MEAGAFGWKWKMNLTHQEVGLTFQIGTMVKRNVLFKMIYKKSQQEDAKFLLGSL